jgi:uncharacterized protein YlxW (UPF0749 family)
MALNPAETPVAVAPPVEAVGASRPRVPDGVWLLQVSALSIVLGVLLALAVSTTDRSRESATTANRFGIAATLLSRYRDRSDRLQSEIVELRRQLSESMAGVETESASARRLREELERLQAMAGLSAVRGRGLRIVVRDSTEIPRSMQPADSFADYMVHDQDLTNLLNELKAAGAQHMGVSGADTTSIQRVAVTTTARCVGPTAMVNDIPLSGPYHIFVIGDPQALRAALERPGGYIRGPRQLEARRMVLIEELEDIALPEFAAPTPRYLKPVPEKAPPATARPTTAAPAR